MLPRFFVVGAQKCGTTSLQHYLSAHPEIYLPEQKETKFFVFDDRYSLGISSYEDKYFSEAKDFELPGEIDPDYMYFPCALERMSKHIPVSETKFIFVLRNPVDRAYSHYLMTRRRGLEDLEFEHALLEEQDRIESDQFSDLHYSYFRRGLYCEQVTRFMQQVGPSNLHFLLSSDLLSNPVNSINKICEFLGVRKEAITLPENPAIHNSATLPRSTTLLQRINTKQPTVEKEVLRLLMPKKLRHYFRERILQLNQTNSNIPEMSEKVRHLLHEKYQKPNEELEKLIQQDLSSWSSRIE